MTTFGPQQIFPDHQWNEVLMARKRLRLLGAIQQQYFTAWYQVAMITVLNLCNYMMSYMHAKKHLATDAIRCPSCWGRLKIALCHSTTWSSDEMCNIHLQRPCYQWGSPCQHPAGNCISRKGVKDCLVQHNNNISLPDVKCLWPQHSTCTSS